MKNHTNYWFGNHIAPRSGNNLIAIGSQPFAQVLLCFSSGAVQLKSIGNKDDPNCWMVLFPMGDWSF